MARSSKEVARELRAVANLQGGYFTAKQAKVVGYGYRHLDYHTSAGNFERVDHGLYRLRGHSRGEHDDLIRLSLWSRNRGDVPQAVISHESALTLHDLGELLPSKIHLTVPPKFRKIPPKGCVLHTARLSQKDVEEHDGFRATTPLQTIVDIASSDVSQEQLEKAVAEALTRGLVRKSKLIEVVKRTPTLGRLALALDGGKKSSS